MIRDTNRPAGRVRCRSQLFTVISSTPSARATSFCRSSTSSRRFRRWSPGSGAPWDRSREVASEPATSGDKKATRGCPCGYFGDTQHNCVCGPLGVERYLARVSGPLLDRIDLHLEVPAVKYRALADQGGGEPSEAVRERVDRARAVQRERFATRPGVYANAHMAARDIRA